ncbi:MAG: hypothetical protein IIC02_02945 [Planctomycetes bacterium]|nr:hypothetical protein [Planctomycetota bacterium]
MAETAIAVLTVRLPTMVSVGQTLRIKSDNIHPTERNNDVPPFPNPGTLE